MKLKKNKILFVLPDLKWGGTQKIVSFVSSKLAIKDYEITLMVIGFKKDAVFNFNTKTIFLNKTRLLFSIPSILKYVFKNKPKVIFSSFTHINIIFAFISIFLRDIKFICRESSVITSMKTYTTNSKIQDYLIKLLYPNFIKIICQSQDMKSDLIKNYNISSKKLVVINNPVVYFSNSNFNLNVKINKSINLITVGRLSPEKGYLRIIENLSQLKKFNFIYKIVGQGHHKSEINKLLESKKLLDKVVFLEQTNEILYHLNKSDLFLQGSYVEGFPNAVLDSCIVGTPVLAYNVPGGTKEIIKHGFNGFLVKNDNEFRKNLNDFFEKKNINFDRKKISLDIRKRFGQKIILDSYRTLFENLLI